jgi:tRNA (cytidine/uridine-2'-O-)-methyltransferase
MVNPNFKIVLYSPEIPGNTGSLGRTCVALDLELILIKPLGFELDEKSVRRAGLDYWRHVKLKVYENWNEFMKTESPSRQHLHFFSRFGIQSVYTTTFKEGDYLVFGKESTGLPREITDHYNDRLFQLPMLSEHIRSLNLSNAATAAIYEGFRQLNFD